MIERGAWARLAAGDACGYLAIAGLLIEATRHGLKATRLSLCNSGDTAGSRDRVVGVGPGCSTTAGGCSLSAGVRRFGRVREAAIYCQIDFGARLRRI